ncbi:hypothetical protein P3T37_001669 [Kitasatospora sp. MAA4]|uniref:Rv1733c family protein n=1 Tax=Kitasatospora sp. MAA4 TaxID=3035093 RepID=UPI0024753A67|nr:hypothetical protein [Kitasatospora sp. MAA4]MDH6132284.1 hypothetical protein [Kitasatospora sp. MAA4]
MSSTSRPARSVGRRPSWLQHLCRAVGVDHNPLCRPVDRARSRAIVLAAAGLALSLGLGAGAAVGGLAATQRQAAEQAARLHPVDSVLLTRAQPKTSPALGAGTSGYQARVTWNYPPGQRRTADVDVSGPAAAGSGTVLWLDAGGRPAEHGPATEVDLVADAVCLGLSVLAGLAMITGGLFSARRHTLQGRAQNGWRLSWEHVEPTWSGRGPRAWQVGE